MSESLRTSKKTLGISGDSRMNFKVVAGFPASSVRSAVSDVVARGAVALAVAAVAGVENARAPKVWMSIR